MQPAHMLVSTYQKPQTSGIFGQRRDFSTRDEKVKLQWSLRIKDLYVVLSREVVLFSEVQNVIVLWEWCFEEGSEGFLSEVPL